VSANGIIQRVTASFRHEVMAGQPAAGDAVVCLGGSVVRVVSALDNPANA